MRPRIVQTDDEVGFHWLSPTGAPTSLSTLVAGDDEPERLVATHLAALDDALIAVAGRYGDVLGGGRGIADSAERDAVQDMYRILDQLCLDYATAADLAGVPADVRAGKIIGTAALFSICARRPLGLLGPAPLDAELDDPGVGVVGGFGEMQLVDTSRPWLGGRWVVRTEAGQRFPLTLSMLLFDSSGVNREAARVEHVEALRSVTAAAGHPDAEPMALACAIDWLLYDWLMANRDSPDSAEIVFPKGQESAAGVIIAAVAASVRARAVFDPGLAAVRR